MGGIFSWGDFSCEVCSKKRINLLWIFKKLHKKRRTIPVQRSARSKATHTHTQTVKQLVIFVIRITSYWLTLSTILLATSSAENSWGTWNRFSMTRSRTDHRRWPVMSATSVHSRIPGRFGSIVSSSWHNSEPSWKTCWKLFSAKAGGGEIWRVFEDLERVVVIHTTRIWSIE